MFGLFRKKEKKTENKKYWVAPMGNVLEDEKLKYMTSFPEYQKNNCKNAVACLGFSGNDPIFLDLEKAKHILVAGVPGSGKSVAINTIINSLLIKNTPSDLKLFVIDPKKVDYNWTKKLPHLVKYGQDVESAYDILICVHHEMMNRFKLLEENCIDNVSELDRKIPRILVVFDEFASLMSKEGKKLLLPVINDIARLGRAAGIHLILATQRPDRTVIDGQLKANCPTALCFRVKSRTDSRVIMDQAGGELLYGNGDGLFMKENGTVNRFQGLMLSSNQKEKIVSWWARQDGSEEKANYIINNNGVA